MIDLEQQLIDDIASFQHDPLGYVLYSFPWGMPGTELEKHKGPRKWQRECLKHIGEDLRNGADISDALATQLAIASGHGIGKSALVSWVIMWAISTFEDTKGVVTANTENQLRTKTWAEVAKWHRLAINSHWFKFTATALVAADPAHEKTWRIDMTPWSEANTEAFAGLHNEGKRVLVIFDEASAIADLIWEVAEGALTDADTEIIWCAFGNPTRKGGRFYECFNKFKHRWQHKQIDSRTVEGTNRSQLQAWVNDYGEDSDFVKVRVRGIFPSTAAGQFINADVALEASKRHLSPNDYKFAPIIITCDPAWEGTDNLVIGYRQGLMYKVLEVMPYTDNYNTVGQLIAQYEDDLKADAVFIDGGGGGTGIVSYGRTTNRNWQLVWFAGKSPDKGYLNMRAYIYGELRKWIAAGGSFAGKYADDIYNEMIQIERKPRVDGIIQIEGKEDTKKRVGHSPDHTDTIAISFAYPVLPRPKGVDAYTQNANHAKTDYDPFA